MPMHGMPSPSPLHDTVAVGFTGHDWVIETEADVIEIMDLRLDPVKIVAAISDKLPPRRPSNPHPGAGKASLGMVHAVPHVPPLRCPRSRGPGRLQPLKP